MQEVAPEVIWTAASLAHSNGVTGLEAIYVVAEDPAEVAARWARFSGLLPRPEGELVRLDCARGRVLIGKRRDLIEILGVAPPAPGLAGYRLACGHPEAFAARCTKLQLVVRKTAAGHAVSLPAALGGIWLI